MVTKNLKGIKRREETIDGVGIGRISREMTRTVIMLLGDKKPKRKVKLPFNISRGYHLTYLCPRIEDALKYIA